LREVRMEDLALAQGGPPLAASLTSM
jgi:hypothetical protein